MTKMQYFIHSLKNVFNFTGRASVDELISFIIVTMYFGVPFIVVKVSLTIFNLNPSFIPAFLSSFIAIAYYAIAIYTALSFVSLMLRRMHDLGKNFIFLLVPLYNIVLLLEDGEDQENEYGKIPV